MRYWWANLGDTYKDEISGNFLWAPSKGKGNRRVPHWESMKLLEPGDLVYAHSKKLIRAIGVVQSRSASREKPVFKGAANKAYASIGWYCDVEFIELDTPLEYAKHKEIIKQLLPTSNRPINRLFVAQQGYLFDLSYELGQYLFGLIDITRLEIQKNQMQVFLESEAESEQEKDEIEERKLQKENIGPLEKQDLVKSRRGQGIFKTNVKIFEKKCRVTGLKDKNHLIASHIKPWRASNNREKIDGNNGLLLSPHVDRLFDHGYISFTDLGEILVSPKLGNEVLRLWNINPNENVGAFRSEQCVYLKYHRDNLFKKED